MQRADGNITLLARLSTGCAPHRRRSTRLWRRADASLAYQSVLSRAQRISWQAGRKTRHHRALARMARRARAARAGREEGGRTYLSGVANAAHMVNGRRPGGSVGTRMYASATGRV